MIGFKLSIPPALAWIIATVDAQPPLVIGAFALTIIFGWRAFKVRDFTSEINGLKSANDTAQIILKNERERREQLEEQLRGAQERANVSEKLVDNLQEELREWRKRYDEKAAGTSLKEVQDVLIQMARQGDKRHEETIMLIRQLAGEKSVTDPP